MSKTTTIDVGGRYFWTLDDVFAVWLEHLVEQIGTSAPDPWLAEMAEDFRVSALCPDFGCRVREATPEQARLLHAVGTAARQRAVEAGDVPRDFTRTGEDVVRLSRVLEVADGFLRLLDGTFPDDPHLGWWFLGTGKGWEMIERLYNDDGTRVRGR